MPPSRAKQVAEEDKDYKSPFPPITLGNLGVLDESHIPSHISLRNAVTHFHYGTNLYITIITTKSGGVAMGLTGEGMSVAERRRFGEDMVSILRRVANVPE